MPDRPRARHRADVRPRGRFARSPLARSALTRDRLTHDRPTRGRLHRPIGVPLLLAAVLTVSSVALVTPSDATGRQLPRDATSSSR